MQVFQDLVMYYASIYIFTIVLSRYLFTASIKSPIHYYTLKSFVNSCVTYTYLLYSMEGASLANDCKDNVTTGEKSSSHISWYASEQAKAMVTMKEMLPQYVTDSFVAAGYDTLDIIAEMTDTIINEIEQFITKVTVIFS